MSNIITDLNFIFTDFLVNTGSLPQYVTKSSVEEVEKELGDKLQGLFEGVDEVLIDQLEELGEISNTQSREKIVDKLSEEVSDMTVAVSESAIKAANEGKDIIIKQLTEANYAILSNTFSDAVVDNIKNTYREYTDQTIARMQSEVRDILTKGYKDGKGIEAIKKDLGNKFDKVRDYRLENIARTEINSAQNRGKQQSLNDNKVEYKQWLTAEDNRVRGRDPKDEYDHTAMHGQVVRVDEEFVHPYENWSARYPGDRSAPIGAWINDRCTHRPYIPGKDENITSTPYYPNNY